MVIFIFSAVSITISFAIGCYFTMFISAKYPKEYKHLIYTFSSRVNTGTSKTLKRGKLK